MEVKVAASPLKDGDGCRSARPSCLTGRIALLAGLLLFSLALTLGLLLWSAKRQDDIAVANSRHLAATAVGIVRSSLEKILTDYTWWDDAYLNMAATLDPDWYDGNFGDAAYLRDSFGITASFLVDPAGRTLRRMIDSSVSEDQAPAKIETLMDGGIDRLIEQARRPVDGEFVAVSGFVERAGRVHIAAARVIHPHTEDMLARVEVTPDNAYLAILMRPIDEELLSSLAQDFGLEGLSYAAAGTGTEGLSYTLAAANGVPIGALAWRVARPSREVLAVNLPALLAVVACIGILGWYVLNSLRRSQADLWDAMLRAQSADRSKTEFLANMSHELRTPLNAIIGFSAAMQDEMFGPLGNKRYAEYSADILESGRHLLDIINDVLELSKIEAGRFTLQESEVDLPAVVNSVRRLIAPRAADKDIGLEVEVAPDLPLIHADARALKQILLNLLSNAVKFTPEGGHVALRLALLPGGGVSFTVADTGPGIARDQLALVMQPFHQADGTLSRSEGGAGLGLPLAASLVSLHGGDMRMDSEVGRGTSVVVTLPCERVALPRAA